MLRKHGRHMDSGDILAEFGLRPRTAIPKDYMDAKEIDGVVVMILPQGVAPIKRRVVALCPECAMMVCAGHLHQHYKIHKEK
jgi:hypothetical protein